MNKPKMRKGAVMMEYVILAVLIAAAALVAIIYFGRTITSQAETATLATAGESSKSSQNATDLRDKQDTWKTDAQEHNAKFHDKGDQQQ